MAIQQRFLLSKSQALLNLIQCSLHSTTNCLTGDKRVTWTNLDIDPRGAGMQTAYREALPLSGHNRSPKSRHGSVCDGGGSGEAWVETYMQPKPANLKYNPRLYEGGLLPRLEHCDEPVNLPEYEPVDCWAPHRAHFGQNDYIGQRIGPTLPLHLSFRMGEAEIRCHTYILSIKTLFHLHLRSPPQRQDILGDDSLTPRDFYTGPSWALGSHNEFQSVSSRLNNPALVAWMEEFEPSRLKSDEKRHRYLFKRINKRKNIKFLHYRDAP